MRMSMYGPPGGPYPDRRDGERPRERRARADAATRDAPPRRGSPPGPPAASGPPAVPGAADRSGFRPSEPAGYRYTDPGFSGDSFRGEPLAGEAFPGTPFA